MSQIKVNSIVPVGGLSSGANGGIIQVKQTVKKDSFSESVGAGNASSVCMSCVITPSSNSSKILIQVVAHVSSSSATNAVGINLDKNGTEHTASMADTDGSRVRTAGANGNEKVYYVTPCICNFIDEPATTSAITYGVRMRSGSGGTQTIKLNRTSENNNDAGTLLPCSSITLFEVTT
tara:strand:+ start:573 stop:1106 length:534 start_codon:yes stop_codon:yes gene_type:complete